jgi:sucrose phosphorylase
MQNGCHLITYPDSLGGNLAALNRILRDYLNGAVAGVHILPFFPSSADRGFAPCGYEQVDPAFGSWEDIADLKSLGLDLTADFMINHLSAQSKEMKDFQKRGDASPYRDFFIRYSRFWPGGEASQEELSRIYTRKPRPPFLELTFADGHTEKIWCTFDPQQIDLNLQAESAREFVRQSLSRLASEGADMIRLDAFAYAVKRPGTSCFFVEPEIWEILDWAAGIAAEAGAEVLPEIHEHYSIQLKLAEKGFWVYDFALPMLLLQALYDADGRNLKNWLSICPRKQMTTLDTHDGIGVVDVRDLMSDEDIERTKNNLFSQGANVKRIYNTPQYKNLDIYQINCTYYSALGNRDEEYLLARAIQFFSPGIPQVYYVGMLAGSNDLELLEKTRNGRDINRHSYGEAEVASEVERPVVRRLLELMRFRSAHPAFGGEFRLLESPDERISIEWRNGGHIARLDADLRLRSYTIRATASPGGEAEIVHQG